jgi:hypothetical protein
MSAASAAGGMAAARLKQLIAACLCTQVPEEGSGARHSCGV